MRAFRSAWRVSALACALFLSFLVGGSQAGAATGIASKTITLGLITSLTGPAASEYTGVAPAARARVALQNAHGGVDGRKIKLIVEDDQTSPASNQTAAQALISKGVFGVIDESAVAFGGAKVLQQAGLPVTGGGYDGPEWGQQPYTNMFSITGPVDPHQPAYTTTSDFVKARGGKVVAAFGYAISPSSQAAATGFMQASAYVGLEKGYLNTSLPFGSIAVGPLALGMKSANVDSMYMPLDANTNFAILTAAKQAGIHVKAAVSATGYGQALLDDTSALADANGTYFLAPGLPVELETTATKAFQAALAKYASFTGVPAFDSYEGWGGADLMIKGLQLAGKNPTQTSVIDQLHKVTAYTGNGLFYPANLTLKEFGKAPKTQCAYMVQLRGSKFAPVPSNGKPSCGKLIPDSNQL